MSYTIAYHTILYDIDSKRKHKHNNNHIIIILGLGAPRAPRALPLRGPRLIKYV